MGFNFVDRYKDYSNTELLNIVNQPNAFQPEAVIAAKKILTERSVSDMEIEDANKFIDDLKHKEQIKQDKIDFLKNTTIDFFEPIIKPQDELKPNKWLNIFLTIVTLQYVYTLYITGSRLIRYLFCTYCEFDYIFLLDFAVIIYIPIIFLLLFKRKRWGWILLFADNLFTVILQISQSYIFFKYQNIHHGNTISFIEPIILRGFFAFFLWKKTIADYFGIEKEVKRKTAIITVLIALSFIVLGAIFL
jgi:predicted RND superfamily exporter protein